MLSRSLKLVPVLVLLPLSLAAQLPISIGIDGRAGWAVPTGEFADSDEGFTSEAGPAYAIGAAAYPLRMVGVFAAYQRSEFGCEQCPILGLDDSVLLHGLEAGLHLGLALGELPTSPWVRVGIVQQTLVFSGDFVGVQDRKSSEPGIGFTGGIGVTVPLISGLEANPGIRYFGAPAEFDFADVPDRSLDVSAFSFDFGLSYRI